ncbi:MAG: nitroreductase family protein [Spirochaetales bacterium]|uniref:Nitroreductase family protein n=1 Tax=Candidatus Thalassospirochaeta sargassi TaxID=3119039 RepID=A0AAJ1MNT7_9SPIO|nr:nitroreductase family protein [Spirochaetales bacterium]
MTYTIDTDKCTFCGLCAEECPSNIITIDKNRKKAEITDDGRCIKCSHCGMICPVGAVRYGDEELLEYDADAARLAAEPETIRAFDHMISSKRSVRAYKDTEIAEGELDAILHAGNTTATAQNSRQVDAMVLTGKEVADASKVIAAVSMKVIKAVLNPVIRRILSQTKLKSYADKNLIEDYHKRVQATIDGIDDAFFFGAPVVVILTYPVKGKRFGRTDCALAGENMMLTAHVRGIGSCMIGFAEAALFTKRLRRKVGIPSDRRIGLVFTLGYQKPEYYRYPKREEWTI